MAKSRFVRTPAESFARNKTRCSVCISSRATDALRVYRVRKSNGNVSFVGLHRIGLSAIWKPSVPNRTALGRSKRHQTNFWWDANRQMEMSSTPAQDVYEIRPRQDRNGFDLISDRLRRGPIWYAGPDAVRNAVAFAKYRSLSRSRWAIIRVYNEAGKVTEIHEQ